MENDTLIVVDEQGVEIEMEILFTFEGDSVDDQPAKMYVLYVNPLEEDGSVYASIYNEEGDLFPIEDTQEWEMVEEVFATFMQEDSE